MKKVISLLIAFAMLAVNFVDVLPVFAAERTITSPSDISGLKAWYDADDLQLSDGDKISLWKNKVGNADYDAVQTNESSKPVFTKNGGISGKAGVKLSDNTFLRLANQFDLDDMSIFTVVKFDSLSGSADDNQIFSKL